MSYVFVNCKPYYSRERALLAQVSEDHRERVRESNAKLTVYRYLNLLESQGPKNGAENRVRRANKEKRESGQNRLKRFMS